MIWLANFGVCNDFGRFGPVDEKPGNLLDYFFKMDPSAPSGIYAAGPDVLILNFVLLKFGFETGPTIMFLVFPGTRQRIIPL